MDLEKYTQKLAAHDAKATIARANATAAYANLEISRKERDRIFRNLRILRYQISRAYGPDRMANGNIVPSSETPAAD